MAYDAEGHRITTYRGETGYWVDDEEEPYFVRAKATTYTAPGGAASTAAQIVQALQAKGIDPSFATTAQLEQARKDIGAPPVPASQVISATSGGMAAPTAAPISWQNMGYQEDTGLPMWMNQATGETTNTDPAIAATSGMTALGRVMESALGLDGTIYQDSAGKYYISPRGNESALQPLSYLTPQQIQGSLGGYATARAQHEASEAGNPLTKLDNFIGDNGPAIIGGVFGGGALGLFNGLGGAGTLAGGADVLAAEGGMFGLPTATSAGGISSGTIGGSGLLGGATGLDAATQAMLEGYQSGAARTPAMGTTVAGPAVAPEYGTLADFLASQGGTYSSIYPATAGLPLSEVAAGIATPSAAAGITLPQAAAGASLAGTAATLGGDGGADYLGGMSADDPAIAEMAKQGIDIGLSDPTLGLPADLADFIRSQGGTYDSISPGTGTASDAPGVPTGLLDGLSNSDLLKYGLPLAGAALGGLGADSSPAGTTTTVQDLPDWLKPYVTGNLDAAKAYMAANPQNNSLLDPARSELNKTIAGDYLNANPANAFYSGAQNYVNPGIAGMQAGASGAYVGQNPADAGYRAAQGYTNPGIDLLRPAATGAYVGQNPSDPYYKAAANYTNASMDYLRPTAEGAFLNANPYIDAMYAKARDAVGTGIDSRFSKAGRYGSGAHQGVLGTTFDNLATDIYGNNYATERANMLSAGGTLISADQAQQAARLAGASGLSGNYQNDRATQLAAAGNLGTLSQAEQAARLAGTAGLSGNYNQDRALQYNYGQAQTAAEQAQQAARLAGASGLSSNYNAARNNQLTAATAAPGFTADAATSPFAAFNAFGNLTKGLGVSQTSSPYFTNPVGGALSGALAGYGLSKAFG